MADRKSGKKRFNFMDLVIIAVTLAFIGAAVYYIVNGIAAEKKSYTVAYTVRLELDRTDADKISEGDNVLSSDGITVIGTVKSIRKEKKTELAIDRRVTAASEQTSSTAEATTTTSVESTLLSTTAPSGSVTDTAAISSTEEITNAAPVTQIIILPGTDHGARTGPLVSYRESEDAFVVYVTVIADVKASDNAYVVNGERVKIGKRAEFLTPYFYAVGEYYDIASAG
ncbi:MAG: hypothetical protein IJS94_00305 [Clostridia bacterium]|nr:hypothetical protein [Clostridia bacterium]